MIRLLLIGGDFDDSGGKDSGFIDKLWASLTSHLPDTAKLMCVNGGYFEYLDSLILHEDFLSKWDIVLWFANVPNSKPKVVENVKKVNQRICLVTSKRNDNHKYRVLELIQHALNLKSNLLVEFVKKDDRIHMWILDPLGNQYGLPTDDIDTFVTNLIDRLEVLYGTQRIGCSEIVSPLPIMPKHPLYHFAEVIKGYCPTFEKHIYGENHVKITRHLGNASFRCTKGGFPSVRIQNGLVYVSRRNINKNELHTYESWVPVIPWIIENKVRYFGEHKPSVDTPVQLLLYNYYPKINYMIHSHSYVRGDEISSTSPVFPCGDIREFNEIITTVKNPDTDFFAINLRGHGSLIGASNMDALRGMPYEARPLPEIH